MTERQTAAALGVSRRTVRYYQARALRRLRGERVDLYRCGRCHEYGHNSRTCHPGGSP